MSYPSLEGLKLAEKNMGFWLQFLLNASGTIVNIWALKKRRRVKGWFSINVLSMDFERKQIFDEMLSSPFSTFTTQN